ncbi:MAG TPA: trypsin-like peptidase domain-containing protein [Candidatus Saccharimonadales bacterium]|nr:trypsin-like peptidase domain-containing protein [Candidatus Saccharimonadales bacterium]
MSDSDATNERESSLSANEAAPVKEYSVSSSGRAMQDPDKTSRLPGLLQGVKVPEVHRPNWLGRGLIIALIVALIAGFGGGWLGASYHGDSGVLTGSLTNQKKVVTSESQLISKIAKTVGPSVVSVNVVGTEATPTDFFGFGGQQEVKAAGTGIIISSDGIVLTNRHVVPAGTKNVTVTLSDGTELKDVKILGRTNSSDSLDVAFLKIGNTKGKKLQPATIGDSSKVAVGDTVVAIGNALGQFQNTVTSGIISGYGRSVQAASSTGNSSENLEDLFQTDAAINEGNSGGPLVNMNGQVIGLNTAIAGNAQNIGFAIPVNDITGLIKQVMDTGKLARPYLGVRYVLLTDDYAYQYNLSVNRGAYIAPSQDGTPSVLPGSPAEKAGLKEKDIITKVDGTNVDEKHSLVSLLGQHQPGDTVNLTVVRDGKTTNIKVKLGTAPTDTNS